MQLPLNQKFSTMTDPQRRAALAWARSHDWGGQPAWFDHEMDLIVSGAIHDGSAWTVEVVVMRTLKELRDWAGY